MFPLIISFITIILWLLSKSNLILITNDPLTSISQIAALIGTVLLSFTFILRSRLKLPEKIFGDLGSIYKNHHLYGATSFLLLISHPLLLATNALSNSLSALTYLVPSNNLAYTAGVLALYSLILLLTFTLLIKLPYPTWLKTHRFMGLVLFFVLVHINLIFSDISRFPLLKIWIIFWILSALFSYLNVRLINLKK